MNNPSVITIANRKGGTGKTTTAVNLAAEWGYSGYKTLLIDLDTQSHCAIGLGVSNVPAGHSIHDALTDKNRLLDDVLLPTAEKNVSIAAANSEYMLTEKMSMTRLQELLMHQAVREKFSRIVIDTPPTLDRMLINGLAAADGVVVPFVPHHLAEVGVRQLARLFYRVAMQYNDQLRLMGLLPVMYDRHKKLHQRVLAGLAKQFGVHRLMRGIRTNIKLAEAFEAGQPIQFYAPASAGSMDYRLMAEELETFLKV